jgi:hypothetical protein
VPSRVSITAVSIKVGAIVHICQIAPIGTCDSATGMRKVVLVVDWDVRTVFFPRLACAHRQVEHPGRFRCAYG